MKNYLYIFLCPFLMGLTACSTDSKGISNMRDMGAYSISDSLHIRKGLLLRSANLADATDEELQSLAALPVTKIIDFRTEPEKTGQIDRLVAGAEYIALPIDVSRDTTVQAMAEEEQQRSSGKKFDIRKMIVMVAFNERAQQIARELYDLLFFTPECQAQYKQFFHEILTTESGAMLYHCSQGKDRTGVTSALLLAALGADRATIIRDFDATNAIYEADVRKYSRRVRFFGGKEEEVAVVKAFIGVNTDNFIRSLDHIDEQYGSMENYLKGPIGLTDEDIRTLRERYLRTKATE